MLKHRFAERLLQHSALIGSYLMFLMLYCNLIPFWIGKSRISIQSGFVCNSAVHIPVRLSILRNYLYACLVEQLGGQFRVEGRRHGENGQILGGKLNEVKAQQRVDVFSPWCWSPCAGDSCGCAGSYGTWRRCRRERSGSRCTRCACPPCGFSGCALTDRFFHSEGRAWGLSPWPSSFRACLPLKQWPLGPRASQRLKNNQEVC